MPEGLPERFFLHLLVGHTAVQDDDNLQSIHHIPDHIQDSLVCLLVKVRHSDRIPKCLYRHKEFLKH